MNVQDECGDENVNSPSVMHDYWRDNNRVEVAEANFLMIVLFKTERIVLS
jgi:hypothetical protein